VKPYLALDFALRAAPSRTHHDSAHRMRILILFASALSPFDDLIRRLTLGRDASRA
jgi:hypothetical protein